MNLLRYAKHYAHLAFSDQLIIEPTCRKKVDILKSISNLTRYMDVKYDTYLHDEFTKWLKRKEIKWSSKSRTNTYEIAKTVKLEQVLQKITELPYKYKIFCLFLLVTGLRTEEAIKAFNHHAELCRDNIIELFWDHGTKKTNAVYCHPLLHDAIDKFKVSKALYLPNGGNLVKKNLGFELRVLRKLNYTITATKVDPLLAEFMQGRRGNVSQKHYFLPALQENRQKWLETWTPIIEKVQVC